MWKTSQRGPTQEAWGCVYQLLFVIGQWPKYPALARARTLSLKLLTCMGPVSGKEEWKEHCFCHSWQAEITQTVPACSFKGLASGLILELADGAWCHEPCMSFSLFCMKLTEDLPRVLQAPVGVHCGLPHPNVLLYRLIQSRHVGQCPGLHAHLLL